MIGLVELFHLKIGVLNAMLRHLSESAVSPGISPMKDQRERLPMLPSNIKKSPDEILQEEFLQELAAVLGRAGESVAKAMDKLRAVEAAIEALASAFDRLDDVSDHREHDHTARLSRRRQALAEINREINRFNRARDHARLRYYYLIVTREALGMRRHHWVEEMYRIPPRKKHLQEV
jgi:hypothetical protein